ncbi:MAG: geranylgeranylglycerol-phosphate geranylgeranyltransferase [Bacteroidota bacterium]|jgi:4-hydroxybenzoate polyprenyltransferase
MEKENDYPMLSAFFRLVRWENLVIIFITQFLFGKYVIASLFHIPDQFFQKFYSDNGVSEVPFHFGLMFNDFNFYLLCFSTVCIAAAGYIINDYFDVKTDRINRPETIIVDRIIKRRVAMLLHVILNVLGVGIGVYIAMICGNIKLSLIHFVSASVLWFYSTNFKKMFIVGNLVVALLIGLVPITVALFNNAALIQEHSRAFVNNPLYLNFITYFQVDMTRPLIFSCFFGLFAFLINFQREIAKDMEDMAGDMETGGKTIPITMGNKFSKNIIHLINAITVSLAIIAAIKIALPNRDFVWYKLGIATSGNNNADWLSFFYLLLFVIIPLIVFSAVLLRSDSPKGYKRAGRVLKLIMLAGILYSFIIWYNFTKTIN